MAKISPVSIKYMIRASFIAEGALEKPDVIGAVFGQTEGLLGADLEMRELQKEGKIGRIEVEVERKGKQTLGKIMIPTALDQSETTLIAAAVETIERVGPSDAQIEVEKIEDVRGSKRDYILDRAKKLMSQIKGSADSREISREIKDSARMGEISEYGDEKLPCGDLSGKEVIVVEGRADVLNLLKNGVKNVIAMNGTKLPEGVKKLSKEKEITLFVDGDRGGKLIIQNVSDNAKVAYVAIAPNGKEVEELNSKEALIALRKKVLLKDYFKRLERNSGSSRNSRGSRRSKKESEKTEAIEIELKKEDKEKLKEISSSVQGKNKAIFLDENLEEIKSISAKSVTNTLRKSRKKPSVIVMDGLVTSRVINAAEDSGVSAIAAKNFATNDTEIQLLSL